MSMQAVFTLIYFFLSIGFFILTQITVRRYYKTSGDPNKKMYWMSQARYLMANWQQQYLPIPVYFGMFVIFYVLAMSALKGAGAK
jgi:hypothetical protein